MIILTYSVKNMKPLPLILCGLLLILSCTKLNELPERVVFLGDSQVRNWDVDYWFPFSFNINKGVAGYTVPDLIEHLSGSIISEKKIVLIGINDIIHLSQFLEGQEVVDSVLNSFQVLTVYLASNDLVLSICPVSEKFCNSTSPDLNGLISQVNAKLALICSKKSIRFVDVFYPLSNGTSLSEDFTQDGLHLNYKGYEIISKTLRQDLL